MADSDPPGAADGALARCPVPAARTAAGGANAIGALAIGRLAVGALRVKRAHFGELRVDELHVGRLFVEHRERER